MPTLTDAEAVALRATNNPNNEPTGHFTGRCARCASKDLWHDMTAYGCNCCGAFFATGDGPGPLLVENGTGRILGRIR